MLSVCLIARNEEVALPRALKSVQAVADEIILVDTGSTDRTVAVATQSGATVRQFEWCDDFAAARNCGLDHARGDWVLWLDADEELLPESHEELRSSLQRQDALGFTLLFQDLRHADRPDHYAKMRHLRLFRRRPELRFVGRCHEHLEPNIWRLGESLGLKVEDSSISLRHYGYVLALRKKKLDRAARLLELELRDRPGQFYYLVEYGRTLLMQRDEKGSEVLAQAAARLLPHVVAAEPPDRSAGLLLEYLLRVPSDRLPEGFTPGLVQALVHRWFPDAPHLLWLLARRAVEQDRLTEAERILRRLIRMGADHSYDVTVSFDPGFVGDDARANLAVCLARQMRLVEARQVFQQLLASPTHAPEARANLRLIDDALSQAGGTSYSFS